MANPSAKKLALELTEVAASGALLESPRGRQALTQALASANAPLLIQAARLLAGHPVSGLEVALRAAYRGLTGERASSVDPGARAKEGLLHALDVLEDTDADLFAEAARCVQIERGKGGPRDTAAAVRARGLLGLARLGHPDGLLLFASGLADSDASVRLAAARAVAHRGDRDGASLLLLRAGVGDEVPEVVLECVRGLIALAPEFGLHHARIALRSPDPEVRGQMLHALGTASHDGAIELLAGELEEQAFGEERRPIIEALGLSLRPRARTLLLELVRGDRAADAAAALAALAIHRYDARLAAQLAELTSESPALARRYRELFPDGPERAAGD